MPRPRNKETRGLPLRWKISHGAYYYQVPKGLEAAWDGKKLFRLGSSLPEAYSTWQQRMEHQDDIRTVGALLDRYALEVVPTKAPTTRTGNLLAIPNLRKVFGDQPLTSITPQMVYRYVDKRSRKSVTDGGKIIGGKVVAHREIEVLSHAYTKAVQWGLIDRHPFKQEVRLEGEPPRDRYVEDWEVVEALALPSFRKRGSVLAIQAYIRIKLMTGMSRGDLLRLTMADIKDDGIHIQRHKTAAKTGKRTIYELTPELDQAVKQAKRVRPKDISSFLFCNKFGTGYIDEETGEAHGWDSMWQRFMDRLLKETKVQSRFTEHDLRAKCASDAESLEHARQLLSHADAKTTQKIYRRKAERVAPLKLPKAV
jgi:integrase